MTGDSTAEVGRAVIDELGAVVTVQREALDWSTVDALVVALDGARRVLTYGAGRSGAVALAFAQRLTHVGLAAASVGEAGNQRLGADDLVVIVSGSGATASALAIADQAAAAGVGTLALITAAVASELASRADVTCRITARGKGSAVESRAPYTAQFDLAALALGEAVCSMLMQRRGMKDEEIELWRPNVE